jgi:hypothetical protein
VEDIVIFQHLLELSDGKINLLDANEELSQTHNLMKVNKKISNKTTFSSTSKTVFKKKLPLKTNTIKRK